MINRRNFTLQIIRFLSVINLVPLASTLLIAWSISATIVPLSISALTPILGPKTFLFVTVFVAISYAVFTLLRLKKRPPSAPEEREGFEMKSAQVPDTTALTQPTANSTTQNL